MRNWMSEGFNLSESPEPMSLSTHYKADYRVPREMYAEIVNRMIECVVAEAAHKLANEVLQKIDTMKVVKACEEEIQKSAVPEFQSFLKELKEDAIKNAVFWTAVSKEVPFDDDDVENPQSPTDNVRKP